MHMVRACVIMLGYHLKGLQREFGGHVVNVARDVEQTSRHQPHYQLCFMTSTKAYLFYYGYTSAHRLTTVTNNLLCEFLASATSFNIPSKNSCHDGDDTRRASLEAQRLRWNDLRALYGA